MASIVVFMFIGLTQFSDGPFIRPHPAIWRIVLAASVAYLLSLVFVLFQNVSDARKLFTFLDPKLGIPLPERSYAENCENQMDIFILAHSVGWYFKALLLRDYWLLWILSVMFEIMEYSLQHQLPNFAECWWDHWILDVLTCNWLGIYLGVKTCEYFQMKAYSWRGIKEIRGYKGKMKRTMAQFTPHSWTSFDWWNASKTFKHYIAILVLIVMFLGAELNSFYLKYLLWIPSEHPLNTYRLIMYGFMGSVATREAFQFFMDPLGTQAWISIACISTETLICIKFGKNAFPNPAPQHIVHLWYGILMFLLLFPIWQYIIYPKFKKTDQVFSPLSKKLEALKDD